ncbi:MAG: ribulose-bisphosphate carboxylase large subunit [Thermoplasmata archaeon]|nr:MAG: ribulose-bisphosphate carboxylase large subunit [Thermoplasmata archaeon]
MVYGGYKYLEFDYEPDSESDIVVWHWVSGSMPIEKLSEALAAESSVGTWTELKTVNMEVFEKLRAKVFRIEKVSENSGFVWLAYPLDHFDTKNILQILASIRGNVYGLSELEALKFLDITFPRKLQRTFSGPRYGLEGVRNRLGTNVSRRPHMGTIVKPKVGLAPKEWADVAYQAFIGGVDFVKDDENLVDQEFCPWEERVHAVLEVIDRVKDETGRTVIYSPNITDRYSRMLERMDKLKEIGWDVAMLDVYMIGYAALMEMVEELHKNGFIIHAHRAGHTAETRGKFGCEYSVFAKIWRLIGVDQLHTGTGVGKMEGAPLTINLYGKICRDKNIPEALHLLSLGFDWDDTINPLMPVASGGLDAGKVDALVEIYGKDVVIQAGGGIHGHPDGTVAGARSLRCAVEGVMEGKSSKEKAEECKELKVALDKWGYVEPEEIRKVFAQVEEKKDELDKILLKQGYEMFDIVGELIS